MDSLKQETSSEEIDQPEKLANDDKVGMGRLYECNFCKRGFTNAQALGGHMNIHRKDKAKLAKSKQVPSEPSISNKVSKEHAAGNYFSPFVSDQIPSYLSLVPHINYQTFVPTQIPSFFNANTDYSSRMEKDCVDANLSLGIGIPYVEENEDRNKGEKMNTDIQDDVDLELRLGL